MKTVWSSHLKDPESKREFQVFLKASGRVFDRLDEIVASMEEADLTAACGEEDFSGDWAAKQAYLMGKIKAYRNIKELLKDLKTS